MSFNLDKYFIMGSINVHRDPLVVLEEALKAGITIFQWREKGENALTCKAYIEFARQCQQLCRKYHVPFIINDDVELALKLNADGIHVGQDDLHIEQFRHQMKDKIIGVSVHSMEELEEAINGGADYVGIGPIFETFSKKDAKTPAGLSFLKEARNKYPEYPMVGIGGITIENSKLVRQAGANGVAVISAISLSENIHETVKLL